jgi:hypothetical protein
MVHDLMLWSQVQWQATNVRSEATRVFAESASISIDALSLNRVASAESCAGWKRQIAVVTIGELMGAYEQ